jgi:hypothetical protein
MAAGTAVTAQRTRTSIAHTAIDGATVEISGDSIDLREPFTSAAIFTVDGTMHEFSAGVRAFGEAFVRLYPGVSFVEEYRFQGGSLRLASGEQAFPTGVDEPRYRSVPLHVAVWEGRAHSVYTHLYHSSYTELIEIFNHFVIVETETGINLIAKDEGSTPQVGLTTLVKEVPEVGLLQIKELTAVSSRVLPGWRGTPVEGGELFAAGEPATDDSECGELGFYLVGLTAVTHIASEPRAPVHEVLERLESLVVHWRGA